MKITVSIHLSIAHVVSQFFEYIAQKFREINYFVKISNSTSSFNFHTSSDNLFVDKTQRQLILRARLYRCQACRYKAPEQASSFKTRARKIDTFQQISWSIFESTWKSVKNVENYVKLCEVIKFVIEFVIKIGLLEQTSP